MKKFFWPDIPTMPDAYKIARDGAWIAFLISAATALIEYLHSKGMADGLPDAGSYPYIGAAIFAVLGFLLLHCSRAAAVFALVLYTADQIYQAVSSGADKMSIVAVFIIIAFVNTVRGTFRYQYLKKEYSKPKEAVGIDSAIDALPRAPVPSKAKGKNTLLLAACGVLAVVLGTGAVLHHGLDRRRTALAMGNEAGNNSVQGMEAGTGERVSFRLKGGGTVSGKIVYEDETYYTLQTMTGEEIVIKEDIAS